MRRHDGMLLRTDVTTNFQALFEATPAPCLALTPSLHIEAATDAYLRATNRTREAIVGQYLFEVFPDNPDAGDANAVSNLHASLLRVLATRAPDSMPVQRYDLLVQNSNGKVFEERYWTPVNSPVLDDGGGVTHIIHRIDDVTDLVRKHLRGSLAKCDIAEQSPEVKLLNTLAMQHSDARFRSFADAMPQMVWSTLPDGAHDYFNQRWYDFTGVAEGSTDGEGWNGIFHPQDQARAWERWRHSLSTGEEYEIQYRLRDRHGAYRWVLGRALPLYDDLGKLVRWMGTCTDIHEQKLAEDQLRRAGASKDEFLAMLAHELRNPLAPISSAAQLLSMPGMNEERVRLASDIIGRQVRHMTELVDDLLDVSRVARGLVELDMAPLDINSIVDAAVEQSAPMMEARMHEFALHLPAAPAWVLGDKTRLVQAIANLLNNAAKYTPKHGKIALLVKLQEQRLNVSVADNGNGISADLLPYVFDLFTQGERTPDRAHGGLGLGLTLVKRIALLHGGDVGVHSAGPGQGSTFTMWIPVCVPQADR